TPSFLVEVLGKTTLERTVGTFRKLGFGEVLLVAEKQLASARAIKDAAAGSRIVTAGASQLWRTAEQQFEELAEDATHILMVRLNAYLELDWQQLLEHHRSHGNKLTRIEYQGQALDAYLVNSSRRNDAAYLLRSGMKQ